MYKKIPNLRNRGIQDGISRVLRRLSRPNSAASRTSSGKVLKLKCKKIKFNFSKTKSKDLYSIYYLSNKHSSETCKVIFPHKKIFFNLP